ncbi:MAG TPA: SRPBCC family protein [Gaiellales bacterium]
MTETVTYALAHRVEAAPATVFAALTEPAAMRVWLADAADVDLEAGRYEFFGPTVPGNERARQRLLSADGRLLRFVWRLDGLDTDVRIALEPDGDACTLTLTHAGVRPRDGAEPSVRDWWHLTLDNLASFAEGRGLAPRVDLTRPPGTSVGGAVEIDAPPAHVWRSLIEPAQLDRWIAERATVEPRVGGVYDFGWDHGPMRILALEPERRLAYSWRRPGDPDTVVTWELEGSGGRTRLTLVHSGFTDARSAGGYNVGWGAFLASFKRMQELEGRWRPVQSVEPVPA